VCELLHTCDIEKGFVRLPHAAPRLAGYLHELATFPKGRHDDQVPPDTSFRGRPRRCWDRFKRGGGPDSGILEYYRMLAEGAGRQPIARERRVRLRVPAGIGRINLLHLNVAADGTVRMLESAAESLLRAGWVRVD